MEFTFDHFVIILGVLLGVGFTLIGIGFTEHFKNRSQKKKLVNALYQEILYNIMTARSDLELCEKGVGKINFLAFHTIAYEQYKLGILLDEDKNKDLLENLFKGYSLIELFNRKIGEFESDTWPQDRQLFSDIEKYLIEASWNSKGIEGETLGLSFFRLFYH